MKKLFIAKEISLPIDAVTQTFAAIGRKGAGKTYLATMIAEQMLDVGAQVIALDPVGNWYGLRIGADGKSKGKEIFVIGGENGDVPLVPEAGRKIAELVVAKNISAVIDISSFRLGERKRFCADFGEELLHLKKKQRTPIHIFIEEAQLIIPQRVGPEEARMVGAFEQIVRLGRNYGIGCTLVTQRPQSVNKEVLSQVECLCVLQITGLHERKALEAWVQEAGADRKLIGELPGLSQGEGYVWSPSWLRIYKKANFFKKTTFDASATPEVGRVMKAAALSVVDVKKLRTDMEEIITTAEKDDPKTLRRRIVELEKKPQIVQQVDPKAIEKVVKEAERAKDISFMAERDEFIKHINTMFKVLTAIGKMVKEIKMPDIKARKERTKEYQSVLPQIAIPKITKNIIETTSQTNDLSGPEQKVLNALAWCESIGQNSPPNELVAFLSGYSHYRSTGYTNPRGYLKGKGLIEYSGKGVSLTPSGRTFAIVPETPLTQEGLHRVVLNKLAGPERKLLQPLLQKYPDAISNTDLCAAAGYMHERSTGYTNPRGRLRSFGLIDYQNGEVIARDILFI